MSVCVSIYSYMYIRLYIYSSMIYMNLVVDEHISLRSEHLCVV